MLDSWNQVEEKYTQFIMYSPEESAVSSQNFYKFQNFEERGRTCSLLVNRALLNFRENWKDEVYETVILDLQSVRQLVNTAVTFNCLHWNILFFLSYSLAWTVMHLASKKFSLYKSGYRNLILNESCLAYRHQIMYKRKLM